MGFVSLGGVIEVGICHTVLYFRCVFQPKGEMSAVVLYLVQVFLLLVVPYVYVGSAV